MSYAVSTAVSILYIVHSYLSESLLPPVFFRLGVGILHSIEKATQFVHGTPRLAASHRTYISSEHCRTRSTTLDNIPCVRGMSKDRLATLPSYISCPTHLLHKLVMPVACRMSGQQTCLRSLLHSASPSEARVAWYLVVGSIAAAAGSHAWRGLHRILVRTHRCQRTFLQHCSFSRATLPYARDNVDNSRIPAKIRCASCRW